MSLDDLRTPTPSGAESETPVRRVDRPSPLRDKVTRAEELRLQLADEIVRGVLPPGSALDETDIARRFSVSRTPVREALRQLVASGLVEARAHRGAVVAVPIPLVPMPIGVQIIAAPWREDIALRVAHALERAGVAAAPIPRGL